MSAFMQVYGPIPRQGPGTPEDVAWACARTELEPDARICDVGCGSGADFAALRAAAPEAEIVGLDPDLGLVVAAQTRLDDPSIRALRGVGIAGEGGRDPVTEGPFDLIWSAGAIYFDGVGPSLRHWRDALSFGGAVAFSAPVSAEDDAEAAAFWGGDAADTEATLDIAIAAAGYGIVARGRVPDAGWEAYYAGVLARCDALERVQDAELAVVIAGARQEAADWSRLRDRVGYALRVVRPR
ncbi:class I SAM-dependent methyltransferase [Jannaschia seohaensis]|uniref:Serine/threonine-protein kinase HipA n=1 Tax=Jannaschia seohaensis TaxID=475081 RepID=A0A2Y9BZL2_9RHOB|nr:class I SAM-dependent methyltransferase [Jannaschia seohaensis]PWJ20466.1 serine/threonine-protein kinase HipA [Jannaschia seohaensis]SSA44562.1 serine/threonine-protein kinase HipA [Jannaschia seohaensis]